MGLARNTPESTPDRVAAGVGAPDPGGFSCDGAENAAAVSDCNIIYKTELGLEIYVEPIERNHAGHTGLTVFKLVAGGAFDARSPHQEEFLDAWNRMKSHAHHVESSARDHACDLGTIAVHHEINSMTVNLILAIGISSERHLTIFMNQFEPLGAIDVPSSSAQ